MVHASRIGVATSPLLLIVPLMLLVDLVLG